MRSDIVNERNQRALASGVSSLRLWDTSGVILGGYQRARVPSNEHAVRAASLECKE